jgi:hypothetical protein
MAMNFSMALHIRILRGRTVFLLVLYPGGLRLETLPGQLLSPFIRFCISPLLTIGHLDSLKTHVDS